MKALTFTISDLLAKNACKNSVVAGYIPCEDGTHQLKLQQENTRETITLINRTMSQPDIDKMKLPNTIRAIVNRELHWLGEEMDANGSVHMVIIPTSHSTTDDSMLDMEAPEEEGAACSLFPEIKPLPKVSIGSHSLPDAPVSETQHPPETAVKKIIPWALIKKTAAEIRAGEEPSCTPAELSIIRQYLTFVIRDKTAVLNQEAKVLWEKEHPGKKFGAVVETMKTKILSNLLKGSPGSRL